MGWDPVPYVIGNGAIHTEAVFRQLAFSAMNGNEGVLGANDLKVTALGTPGASVNVGVGGCGMIGRGSSQLNEMYTARMPTLDTVSIAATGAGAGRSDLVIGRVEDPNIVGSGWAQPGNVAQGPYMFTRVISGVPNTTRSVLELNLGYSAVTLARIDLPVSTSAVTQAMIVDLRKIANPRRDRRIYTVNPGGVVNLTAGAYTNWFGSWSVDIPAWATRAVMVIAMSGVRLDRSSVSVSGTAQGLIRGALGGLFTQGAAYDLETSISNVIGRNALGAGDTVAISSGLRGTTQTLTIQGYKTAGNKNLYADGSTFASVDIEFQESAV